MLVILEHFEVFPYVEVFWRYILSEETLFCFAGDNESNPEEQLNEDESLEV